MEKEEGEGEKAGGVGWTKITRGPSRDVMCGLTIALGMGLDPSPWP